MYYLFSLLGAMLGLDALTYAVVFILAYIGTRILRYAINNVLLVWSFFPILCIAGAFANVVGQAMGVSYPFEVPLDDIGLVQTVPIEDFLSMLMVTFAGVLSGLGIVFGVFRLWGHTGEVKAY